MVVEAGMLPQPLRDFRMLMRSEVVADDMKVRALRRLTLDPLEKLQSLLMKVPWLALRDTGVSEVTRRSLTSDP